METLSARPQGIRQITPTPKRAKRRGNPVAGFIIIAVIIAILAIALSGGSKKTSNKLPAATQPTQSSTNSPAATQPAQPTTAQQIADWDSKYGSILSTLSSDLSNTGKDAGNQDETALLADCQQLQTDISTAQADPAIPDNNTEQHWSSALSYYQSGAQDCVNGLNNQDANQVSQAASEFSQGNTELTAANNALGNVNQ